jgi:hypothetical protein
MYKETLKIKNRKLIPNSFYRTWKMYDGIEKGVRMREMTKEELARDVFYRMVDKLSPKDRLETFKDLVIIWKRLKDVSINNADNWTDEQLAMAEVIGSYCNVCGYHCRKVVDEKHGEEFIVCCGSEWMATTEEQAQAGKCEHYGMETEGLSYFYKEMKE